MNCKYLLLFLSLAYCSCNSRQSICEIETGNSKVDTMHIDLHNMLKERLDTTKYSITEMFSLATPDSIHVHSPLSIKCVDNRIYVMSRETRNKNIINAFDKNGNYLYSIGKSGHAKNEFIDSPTCFSIDYKNGSVHIYERASNRVLVFDKKGKFQFDVKFEGAYPNSACLTETGDYLCSFNERQSDYYDRLALYGKSGKRIKSLLPIGSEEALCFGNVLVQSDKSFSCFYHPFSDLVTVVNNDGITKFIKMDFNGEFLPKETANKAITEKSLEIATADPSTVQMIEKVEMTDKLIHVNYAYNNKLCHFLYDIKLKTSYNNDGSFFAGIWPSFPFWIDDNKLLYVITEDDINNITQSIDTKNGDGKRWYNNTHSKIRDIIDGKVKTPVFVSISIP